MSLITMQTCADVAFAFQEENEHALRVIKNSGFRCIRR